MHAFYCLDLGPFFVLGFLILCWDIMVQEEGAQIPGFQFGLRNRELASRKWLTVLFSSKAQRRFTWMACLDLDMVNFI
jgi:hypothetical protein